MAKFYSQYKKRKTRLAKVEEKKSIKQALFFIFLTIILVFILISVGIPSLIKMIAFLGDIHSSSQKIETNQILLPNPPVLQPLVEATNSARINVVGFADKKVNVKLIINQIEEEVTVGENGKFIFKNLKLKLGENKIKAKAIDELGNESNFSSELLIIFDNQPPELKIVSPQDKDKFFDKDKQIVVKGITEAGINVFTNGRLSVSDFEGNFSSEIELKEGENRLEVKAKDKAGNETVKQITVTYIP